jgi:AraC-like DNA-binding protein
MPGSEVFQTAKVMDEIAGSVSERRDMHDRWLAFLGRHLFTYRLSSSKLKDPGFQINARSRSMNGFTAARFITIKGRAQLVRESPEIGADARNGYVVYMSLRGSIELSQFGRKELYEPLSAAMLSTSDPLLHTKCGDNDTACLVLPREFVDQRVLRGEDLCARPSGRTSGVHRLFADTMLAFQRDASAMTDNEFSAALRLVSELALLCISGSREVMSNLRSVRTSNLARVKRVMRIRSGDPGLTLSSVARECGLSLRYLHDLFKDDGRTAREYLMGERLMQARRMLESAADNAFTVTSVSMACGFSNSSQFSTVFRRAFGLSPRDVLRRH